jgi:hypothetical protein
VKIEPVTVPSGSELSGHTGEWPPRRYSNDALDVGIVTEQGSVGLFREYGDAGRWVTVVDGAEEWGSQEDVAD